MFIVQPIHGKFFLLISGILIVLLIITPALAKQDDTDKEDKYKIKDEWKGKHMIKEKHGDLTLVAFLKYSLGDPDGDGSQDGYEILDYKWYNSPVYYTINPSYPVNNYGLVRSAVVSAIKDSFESWDTAADLSRTDYTKVYNWKGKVYCLPYGYQTINPIELFNNTPTIKNKAKASISSPDYTNVVTWGRLSENNVLALTTIWYYTSSGQIIDADIIFNTAYRWGIDTDGEKTAYNLPASTFDIRNIGTHEAGHVCGLADLYNPVYAGMTMYGYGSSGEVKKMSLEPGDVAGIQAIY